MAAPRPLELDHTADVDKKLSSLSKEFSHLYNVAVAEVRLLLLEAVSSRLGGFDFFSYQSLFNDNRSDILKDILCSSEAVFNKLIELKIHPALTLSILAREVLEESDRKKTGAYHTDFRLAQRIADLSKDKIDHHSSVIDPACGSGILLVAVTLTVCGKDRNKTNLFLSDNVYACDLSSYSLRGCLLSLSSLTNDLEAINKMKSKWFYGDSLLRKDDFWLNLKQGGFDLVIGNPPWEKIKLSKHEHLKSLGEKRTYGEKITNINMLDFERKKKSAVDYTKSLLNLYPSLGFGEPDLYIAFTELFFKLCRNGGFITAIVPGGFIRSQGSGFVREKFFNECDSISISIIDNKAKFFAIDTRFKFLAMHFKKKSCSRLMNSGIKLLHEKGTDFGIKTTGSVFIGKNALKKIRPDYSIPEVKNNSEWILFLLLYDNGVAWNSKENGWGAKFCREVDMTKDKPKFSSHYKPNYLPVIEGRMISAYRFGCKGFTSGAGRSAIWETYPIGDSRLNPQFWIEEDHLSTQVSERANSYRIGFCDISGQTNERTFMAAIVKPGVVCGNKVPTIAFENDKNNEGLYVWLAVANSFVFDWALRRVLSTTVNYFILQSLPFPRIVRGGLPWNSLYEKSLRLSELDVAGNGNRVKKEISKLRAEIDAEIAIAYGLNLQDMEIVFEDFPLLDRTQPFLEGEDKSTITRDTVMACIARKMGFDSTTWKKRKDRAEEIGAIAYVTPQSYVKQDDHKKLEVRNG